MLNIAGLQQSSKARWPGAEPDEYINLRDVKGWQTDLNIQVKAFEPDPQNPDRNIMNGSKYNFDLAYHMIVEGKNSDGTSYPGWRIHQPPVADKPTPDLPYDKDKYLAFLIELIGGWLNKEFNARDYSIAPVIAKGKVDADGEPLTFPETGVLRAEEPVAGSTVAGS